MDKETLLKNIGLSDKEAKTYLAVLELGQSTIKPIATRSGIKRTSIYNFINHLVELGLITQTEIRGRMHYKAESPAKLVELQKERVVSLQKALPDFLSIFNSNAVKPKINYYEGPEQIKQIGREALNCSKEALYFWPGPELTDITGGAQFWSEIGQKRAEKGISVRLLRFHGKEPLYPASFAGLEFMRETRWAPKEYENEIDLGIAIYDNGKIGIFGSKEEAYGILIESPSLAKAMKLYFELLWEKSTPAKPGEG